MRHGEQAVQGVVWDGCTAWSPRHCYTCTQVKATTATTIITHAT
jgi:hypothetical protein